MTKPSDAVTPERIMQFAWGYAPPLAIEAGVRHHVFDVLDSGPKTLEQVVAATGTSERGMRALLNMLVGLGLLTKNTKSHFALVPESATFLVSTKPTYLGGFLKHTSTQLVPRWLQLTEIVRTGEPATSVNQEQDGTVFFQQFVADLFPFNYPAAQALADALGVASAQKPIRVLDLAAGSGVWGIALAQKGPKVQVAALDWPGVLSVTRQTAERLGLADRFEFIEGDLAAAPFGTGYDVAILGHILHSEGVARSRSLLKKTAAALNPGGTIAIAEWLVNDDRTEPVQGLIFGVNMLVNTDHGDAFSFNEIQMWLQDAGFEKVRTLEAPGPSPLILANRK